MKDTSSALILPREVSEASKNASCLQAIAKSTAFTISMFAPLTSIVGRDPSFYR